ncbi:hypothetical protein GUITHDRAFT_108532 [Guillardia theta CCMP2712]|uniref:Symplekin C-terminal domain-containing protein n=1 Tax=Guillardia theta (strain CCMP2712) TaxID=905079 RepID=L1JC35_GUITC|nr:hypothetical protein GUITHDRAFT_108532 [Guillardia theta CCMP2712]EKX45655.1 hypothetical protein GUITHDRAFT_108532 [Guillardia theta CCMP2712]|eukprot:XP_005832635.1 hypothetical protein GUITHDRAFT_108532 [Guillardia theta CCMP2712]
MKEANGAGEGDESKAAIHRHLLHLFLALCAQNHELLHDLIDTYVKATSAVRTAVQGCVGDMIKAIGPESPVLLQVISNFPPGAEILMLAFVRTLTDVKDARFMIYIWQALSRNEIESLLPKIVSLPQASVCDLVFRGAIFTYMVMGILSRLISKQVWTMPTLWEGFVKCCRQTLPRSLPVLVQLPPQQLVKAVQACKDLGPPMAQHVQERLAKGYPVPQQILTLLEPWLGSRGYKQEEGREKERATDEMQEDADR